MNQQSKNKYILLSASMSVSQTGQEKKIFLSVSTSASMAEQEQKYSRQCVCPRAMQVRNRRTPVREYVF